ncbi:LOW QUALITY PROTEIN: SEC23-interacting protein [Megalops cyprinoides]|uniref:LOW QUALITY PROTEIN: SEC23-interacting protein n=1 Tax=Megalops cyprinoides TaxID=118141 RepID=UPI001864E10B|nr:LOW QUALITY PROTEIN: SEC23-interacting protein [Megalops cyprinoides]
MAERKTNSSSNTNLLFSTTPQFNFNLPFIPVSQASSPAVLSGDDSADVGEEDSFLGQVSGSIPQPSTFSYFSSPANSSDPFASIGGALCPSPTPPSGPSLSEPAYAPPRPVLPPVVSVLSPPPVSQIENAANQSPAVGCTPPPNTAAPHVHQQGYNPYRHTPLSSRVNPYLTPPELQQSHVQQQAPFPQSLPHAPPQAADSPPQTYHTTASTFTQGQALPTSSSTAGPLVPATTMMPYAYNVYEPVQPHWFYCKQVESKIIWLPFSILDSVQLEETFNSIQPDPESVVVCTTGGRYDVQLYDRLRTAVVWEEEPSEVRRCTWFYKGTTDSRFIPYSEEFSDKLEGEYKKAVFTNQWHRRLEFPTGETIVMHNPKVIVQFQPSAVPDEWGTTQDGQTRPRVVKRGIDDDHDEVPDGELPQVDHLVFMVHGIGPVCDLRFRSMVECVDDFRSVSLKLLHSHFQKVQEERVISRVEFLPVQWHMALHGDATGVDRRIKKITLPSTGRLRHFTNETLLDVLFYNSPTYCQTIVDKVALEINRLYALFMERNPDFKGGISVAGHSLGSLILFDLLSNQKSGSPAQAPAASNGKDQQEIKQVPSSVSQANGTVSQPTVPEEEEEEFAHLAAVLEHLSLSEYLSTFEKEKIDMESLLMCTDDDLKEMGIPLGPRKKITKFVKEMANNKQAATERSTSKQAVSAIATPTQLPDSHSVPATPRSLPVGGTVSSMHVDYNYFEVGTGQVSVIYHALDFEPVNFFALGSPIGMFLTVRGLERIEESYQLPTCRGFFNIYHPLDPVAYRIEPLIIPDLDLKPVLIPHHKGRKRLHLELKESLTRMGSDLKQGFISSLKTAWQTLNDFARAHTSSAQLQAELEKVANQIKEEEEKQNDEANKLVESPDSAKEEDTQVKIGMLNGGNRIDYVLQEKPIESFNEYLFALQSHLCYWESEDTALLILKEIYKNMGIQPEQAAH